LLIFKKEQIIDLKNALLSLLFTVATAFALGALIKISLLSFSAGVDLMILVLALILIFLNIILYRMIHQVQLLLKNKYELSLIQEKMASEKSRLDEAAVIWDNVRRLRHDLKNHFTVLVGKLEDGDTDSCKKYLSELNQTVDSMGNLIRSGNAVIDYLINAKLSNLDNVQVLVSGYVGNYSDIEEIDLACILGNILDNAIEAQQSVKGEKRIELHFLYKNAARIIVCKNTVGGSVLKNNKDLLSTKDSSELHGLGHRIVETTVKKYGGIVDYYEDGEMFGVQILLPIKA
jgi:sensor histidine kinase regulating citrate/malate metabolism